MKYIRELIITVLILALAWLAWDSALERRKLTEFVKTEKALKAKFDSVVELQHKADVEAILALTKLEQARYALRDQSVITEKYKLRYETIRHTAVPRLSDAQIDSTVARLYPIR